MEMGFTKLKPPQPPHFCEGLNCEFMGYLNLTRNGVEISRIEVQTQCIVFSEMMGLMIIEKLLCLRIFRPCNIISFFPILLLVRP